VLRYGSPFNGIGSAQTAWEHLGWECAWTSEIDPFAIRVAKHHVGAPELGDINGITTEMLREHGPIDLLVGGSPCQSYSSLGKRRGMDDPRGKLALRFLELAGVARPRWIVFENVPRIKSSNKGRDFGTFLGKLEELGYGWAYRTFDAQYFGLAQSRERMFVVGYRGDWRRAAAVLFERQGIFGASSPHAKNQEGVAGTAGIHLDCGIAAAGAARHRVIGFHANAQGCQIASQARDLRLSAALTASQRAAVAYEVPGPLVLGIDGFNQSISGEVYHTLRAARDYRDAVAIRTTADGVTWWKVRRLMPIECERLQGFSDGFTQVPDHRGKPAADTPRYEAIGNAMPVPVMSWIGEGIQMVDAMDNRAND
jgi:DNA (cytosine-5)-methyltransferase 1